MKRGVKMALALVGLALLMSCMVCGVLTLYVASKPPQHSNMTYAVSRPGCPDLNGYRDDIGFWCGYVVQSVTGEQWGIARYYNGYADVITVGAGGICVIRNDSYFMAPTSPNFSVNCLFG